MGAHRVPNLSCYPLVAISKLREVCQSENLTGFYLELVFMVHSDGKPFDRYRRLSTVDLTGDSPEHMAMK